MVSGNDGRTAVNFGCDHSPWTGGWRRKEDVLGQDRTRTEAALAQSIRWGPLLDFLLKLAGATWVVMSFVSSVLVNDYLSVIGQTAVPIDFTGSWGSLLIIGGVLTIALTAMAAVFTGVHPLMSSLHDGGEIARSTRLTFLVGGLAGTTVMGILVFFSSAVLFVLASSVLTGVAIGSSVIRFCPQALPRDSYAKMTAHVGLWVGIATLASAMLTAELYVVTSIVFEPVIALVIAAGMACLPQLFCFSGPYTRYIGWIAVVLAWFVMFVAPGYRIIILFALHCLHLGGGVTASPITSAQSSRICNLGTAERPVIYYSAPGCTKTVAVARFKQISQIDHPALRGDLVACWRDSVHSSAEKCGEPKQ